MGSFFKNLLVKRGLKSAPVPLWKLEIDDGEYEELKTEIQKAAPYNFYGYAEECALFYAEAWRREYSGRTISKKMVASFANCSTQAGDMFNCAMSALSSLKIPLIQLNTKQYFRTLLLQGGLPITRLLQNSNRFDAFSRFLKGLIASFSRLETDWDDVSSVENLSCVNYLPSSYRNDNIYAVSLQIVQAIVENNDELLPYRANTKELEALTDSLKEENDRVKKLGITHPLIIDWNFKIEKTENQKTVGVFLYELREIKTITSDMVSGLNSTFQFDLFVSRLYIATYKKVKEDGNGLTVYKRISLNNRKITWNGECSIEVKLLCDNGVELFPSVINGCAPNLEFPQLLFEKEKGIYSFRKGAETTSVIALFSRDYRLQNVDTSKDIFINDQQYRYENVETATTIVLLNPSGKQVELKNESSNYSVVYGIDYLSWMESSNYIVASKNPRIRVYDENGCRVDEIGIEFRMHNGNSWQKYSGKENLPYGLLEFKVEFPDGKLVRKSFYYVGNLDFKATNVSPDFAEIICSGFIGCVSILPVKASEISCEEIPTSDNLKKWEMKKRGVKCPVRCNFEIKIPQNPVLQVSIPSPFQGLSLVKNDDEDVPTGTILSLNALANYRILFSGKKSESDVKISCGAYAIHQTIKNGITPLSIFENAINRVSELNGENPFRDTSCVMLKLNGMSYEMRYFSLNSLLNKSTGFVEIRSKCWVTLKNNVKVSNVNDDFVSCGNLRACKLLKAEEENEIPIEVFLEHLNCGSFRFPECSSDGDYLVFSDAYDNQRIIPKVYRLSNGRLEEEQGSRLENSKTDIQNWFKVLDKSEILDDKSWGKIPLYMEIAEKWNLPFKSFNIISASIMSPKLVIKLLLRLFMDGKINVLSSAILKMEQEYALAIHWNRAEYFNDVISALAREYPDGVWLEFVRKFSESIKNLLTLSLDSKLAELILRFLGGNLENKKPDQLSNAEIRDFRSKAVGSDLPSIDLPLKKCYYASQTGLLPYQKTLIDSPLYVYEYTQGKNNELWNSDSESMKKRRIIGFYQRYFSSVYYEILTKMLQ